MLRFRNEISLTLRFENDFGNLKLTNNLHAPNAYLVPSCLFARTAGEWPGD